MNGQILTFNYPKAKGLVVCGDIHGAFEEMVFNQSWNASIYGVLFSMLDIMEFKEVLRE